MHKTLAQSREFGWFHATRRRYWRGNYDTFVVEFHYSAAEGAPMAESSAIRRRYERFAESGEKHAFRLLTGQDFLGWVVEVGEDAALVSWAPSPFYAQATGTDEMSPPDEWVRFVDIEPTSLAYWDDTARRWIDFADAQRAAPPDDQSISR